MTLADRLGALECRTLALEVREAILTVTITRPEVLNALSPEVIAELRSVVGALRDGIGAALSEAGSTDPDWSVRGLVITGAGEKSFVAGADIAQMREMSVSEADLYTAEAQELTGWLETLPVPVVAAVNGFALGGGCELAMSCDVILASANAAFGQPEVALGLIPGFGGCVRLQQYVGVAAARELILTGRRISAAEAARLGLVSRVLDDQEALIEAAREVIALAARQSPTAVAAAKRTIRAAQAQPTDTGLAIEREAFVARFGTPDMREGTAAFVEKRRPEFPGA